MFIFNMKYTIFAITSFLCATLVLAQKDPHFWDDRNTIVQLFEWKWSDIADECENFLSQKGFAGVQISPPSENAVVDDRPWWERYQPVSYILSNRGGDENTLADMIKRCNNVGIRIYADLVVNHMATSSGQGSAGSTYDPASKDYPAVPYSNEHFHATCDIDYNDAASIRNCELSGLKDLDQSQDYVRGKIRDYMNHLISLGVAGFRVDAAKYIWPADLEAIYASLNDLNTEHGFADGARAFIYQEVIDTGSDPVSNTDYIGLGRVCEYKYGDELSLTFRLENALSSLENFGTGWGLLDGGDAVAFIDNYDTQRNNPTYLSYKESKTYQAAIAFMLAYPYEGITKIFSGYNFNSSDQGPPNDNGSIISPEFDQNGTCTNGWTCEHRWHAIYNMVAFRQIASNTSLENWWYYGSNQLAFSRGDKAFIAFTFHVDMYFQFIPTRLPSGIYCDIISGSYVDGNCTGKTITVDNGYIYFQLFTNEPDAVIATHVNAKL